MSQYIDKCKFPPNSRLAFNFIHINKSSTSYSFFTFTQNLVVFDFLICVKSGANNKGYFVGQTLTKLREQSTVELKHKHISLCI
jgi:hypothetical protein